MLDYIWRLFCAKVEKELAKVEKEVLNRPHTIDVGRGLRAVRAERERRTGSDFYDDSCAECIEHRKGDGHAPSHAGSIYCYQKKWGFENSIASGGERAHCTCDACF